MSLYRLFLHFPHIFQLEVTETRRAISILHFMFIIKVFLYGLFRMKIILQSTLLNLIFTNISCVRHHCQSQTYSMNLADFPCFSLFFLCFFFFVRLEFVNMWGIIWCCMSLYCLRLNFSYILSLNWQEWEEVLISSFYVHYQSVLPRRSGWKEYCIFFFFSLNSQTFKLIKTPLPNTWLILLWFGYLDMMDSRFCHFCLIVSIFYGVKKWSTLLVMMSTINLYGVHLTSFTRVADR